MSPEAIKQRIYSKASDVWSFGVTLWEITARQDPYPNLDPLQTALEVCHGGLRLAIPPFTPSIIVSIMKGCFEEDPDRRPTFAMITDKLQNARTDEWMFGENKN